MSWNTQPDLISLIAAFLVSVISGFISIVQRISSGQRASIMWVISEFLAAILCGYLVFDLYPVLQPQLPVWATLPILVALGAHMGGRSFQWFENMLHKKMAAIEKDTDIQL